jgi:hypothetical protein
LFVIQRRVEGALARKASGIAWFTLAELPQLAALRETVDGLDELVVELGVAECSQWKVVYTHYVE